ncbi:MAG: DNA topoisomerase IV subunit A [Planctomycetes bacterium]|nr:DNA topoisomerase IV subunit A [Planctomycetota bacterium]
MKSTSPRTSPRTTPGSSATVTKDRDKKTLMKIDELGEAIVKSSLAQRDPHVDIPMRTVSNTKFNKSKRILEMGSNAQRRNLFNLSMAKKFMQTVLLADGCKDLIEAGKTLSLRGMYYKSLHTIEGTNEKTFNDQSESDPVLEDLEVSLGALREELHVYARKAGTIAGNITLIDSGDEIDCRRMGSGGYSIPSICEPSIIQFKKCEAKFVLHVEKNTIWSRFNEDRFWQTHNCILTEGGGQPPRGVRRLLRRLHEELGLPIYCLLDCDPWGHYIYSVIKQGSINLAFESQRMAVPDAKFIGIRAQDYERCELSDDVKITLTDRDITRAQQIAEYPWFVDKKPWQREIERMLANGFKMEVESLITKDISYVTETYVPQRLEERDFLD